MTQKELSDKIVNVRGKAKGNPANAARQKVRCIMAEKKMTEVQAIGAIVEFAVRNGFENDEVLDKLNHMVEVRSRKRERKTDDSKRLANIALGEQFAEAFEGETFKAKDVAEFLNVSVSKACAVCRAMEWDEIPTTEKVKVYTL